MSEFPYPYSTNPFLVFIINKRIYDFTKLKYIPSDLKKLIENIYYVSIPILRVFFFEVFLGYRITETFHRFNRKRR